MTFFSRGSLVTAVPMFTALLFQTATSFKTFIDNWNIQTAVWLKTSVLSSLSPPGFVPVS